MISARRVSHVATPSFPRAIAWPSTENAVAKDCAFLPVCFTAARPMDSQRRVAPKGRGIDNMSMAGGIESRRAAGQRIGGRPDEEALARPRSCRTQVVTASSVGVSRACVRGAPQGRSVSLLSCNSVRGGAGRRERGVGAVGGSCGGLGPRCPRCAGCGCGRCAVRPRVPRLRAVGWGGALFIPYHTAQCAPRVRACGRAHPPHTVTQTLHTA